MGGRNMIHHVCISGFTQDVDRFHGVLNLSEKIRGKGLIDCNNIRIYLYKWNTNWANVAEQFSNLETYHACDQIVCIYAYSWGAGWGAMELARQLRHCNIQIRIMVLSDPVYRSRWLWMRWRSLLSRDNWWMPVIYVPTNVKEIHSFYQTTNHPCGHRLLALGDTIIHPAIHINDMVHSKMDDSLIFHNLVLSVINRVNSEKTISTDSTNGVE